MVAVYIIITFATKIRDILQFCTTSIYNAKGSSLLNLMCISGTTSWDSGSKLRLLRIEADFREGSKEDDKNQNFALTVHDNQDHKVLFPCPLRHYSQ